MTSPDIISIVKNAALRYNVDPNLLEKISSVESNLNPSARNPRSSAGGLFQFIDKTAQQYGLKDRYNPEEASDAAARLTRDNINALRSALGREPTPNEVYLAHQQGAQGAINLIRNPNATATDVVGTNAALLNGGTNGMSAQQFINQNANRFGNLPSNTGGQNIPMQAEARQPTFGSLAMNLNGTQQSQASQPNVFQMIEQYKNGDKLGAVKTGLETLGNVLSSGSSRQEQPQEPLNLPPVQGVSADQATALSKLLQTLRPKFGGIA